jgi:DNA primase
MTNDYPMDQVTEIREKIDIISYLSEFMTLKKAGRNFKGLCPFHNEKSPSFMVSPERQMWHCFGCGKGGDIYTFLMEYEHVEFPEALRVLAKRAGVELVQSRFEASQTSQKERLYAINALAAEYYQYILLKHPVGKKALAYLTTRGLSEKVIQTFQLGFAPGSGTALTSYLLGKKRYPKEEILEAGLAYDRGRSLVDFFRGRLMFPLIDHRDNVVGFSGRVLDKEAKTSKYINTRETLIYHKGDQFYGLNITKDAIRKANQAILVEGEFDVISSYQEGVSNVVAVKGTALTQAQIVLIGRYAQKLTVCFDGDRAGQEAIKRGLPLIEKKNLKATVIVLTNGKDPDEAIKNNPGVYKQAVKNDVSVYDYLFDAACKDQNVRSAEGKKAIADEFLPVIASMTNEIIKEHYLRKLGSLLQISYESISKELSHIQKKDEGSIRLQSPLPKRSRDEMLEEYLISLIMQAPVVSDALNAATKVLAGTDTQEKAYQKLLATLADYLTTHDQFTSESFAETLPSELLPVFDKSLLFPIPPIETPERYVAEVKKVAKQLRELTVRERIKQMSLKIQAMEESGQLEAAEALKEQYTSLLTLLQSS